MPAGQGPGADFDSLAWVAFIPMGCCVHDPSPFVSLASISPLDGVVAGSLNVVMFISSHFGDAPPGQGSGANFDSIRWPEWLLSCWAVVAMIPAPWSP